MKQLLIPAMILLGTALHAAADGSVAAEGALHFSSGDRRVTLVELYTSEGCSSCPPADRWVSRLVDDPRLWKDVVPLSFHVDYWDWIGWSDRFAHPDYSARQRQHIREGNARVVYTPGFFANGKEWRGFFEGEALEVPGAEAGQLALTLNDRDVRVQFEAPSTSSEDLKVHVALLGMGLETRVGAGENHGRTLQHDFVVLSLKTRKLEGEASSHRGELRLPRGPYDNAAAIAAWVSEDDSLRPLQAVGGFLR